MLAAGHEAGRLAAVVGCADPGEDGTADALGVQHAALLQVLDEPEEAPDPQSSPTPSAPVRGLVEFDHVRFSYTPERPLITDLSLRAEPGRTIAIWMTRS